MTRIEEDDDENEINNDQFIDQLPQLTHLTQNSRTS